MQPPYNTILDYTKICRGRRSSWLTYLTQALRLKFFYNLSRVLISQLGYVVRQMSGVEVT